jgi:hypothetical protein
MIGRFEWAALQELNWQLRGELWIREGFGFFSCKVIFISLVLPKHYALFPKF